ncbi:Protein MMS22-like like protein [Argiope bruennichi]|uniref:Protein MMS22-like n=1 Tax=Argiope bruennichi TaxID=94029 RepID=A0A8T0E8R7_ARGBR|nr:Protein MMS22-like like protein [Argiope bruennichi]
MQVIKMDSAALLNCKYEYQNFSECSNSPLLLLNEKNVILFKGSYSVSSVLWNSIHFLFGEIKKHFFIIKTLALDKTNLMQNEDPLTCIQNSRIDISRVFQCILKNLQCMNSCSSSDLKPHYKIIATLVKEIKHLLIFVGRINDIPNIVTTADSVYSSDYHYCYVHLFLELWYNSIKILVAVNNICVREGNLESFCNDLDQLDTYLQVITLFIIDYICITVRKYRNSDSLNNTPFVCKCFEDFWGMLMKVFNSKLVDEKYSFWTVYHNSVQSVQNHVKSGKSNMDLPIDSFSLINESIECSQLSESCLWLTSHIAHLYILNNCNKEQTVYGYPVVKFLIHSLLISSSERTERNLRFSLFYTWEILSFWEPSSEVLLTLTDFYIKKIDETFSLNENGLENLPYLFSDCISWFNYIDNLSNTCITVRNETSFYIYLRILYKQLTMDCSEGNLWRSLKGRVYSKFMPKKLIELPEVGLQNSFSLILTIAASGQVEAVDKISSLISIFKTCNIKKQLISWKALFVLILIYQKKSLNLNKIITKAVEFFNSKCFEYYATKDNLNKLNLMNLLFVYINGMKEVFKQCDFLKLSEYELVASGFSLMLSSSGVSELNSILYILLEIFQKVQDMTSDMDNADNSIILDEYLKFLKHSFKYIYPFLEKISNSDTPPIVISDLAAIFTILSYKFSSSLAEQVTHNFLNIFLWFGCKRSLNSSVMCHYLWLVLKDESLQTNLKKAIPNFTSLVFRSWLKVVIDPPILPPACEEVHELSFKVLLLRDFMETFPQVQDLEFRSDPIDIAIKVFEIMGQKFEEISDLKLKHQLKLKASNYFQNFASCASVQIKKLSNSSLSLVYKVISHLVDNCSLLLHMHYSSDSVLQHLFDQVILVHKIFSVDKSAQSVTSHAINEFLPRFLKGIFKLDYRKDKFAERVLKQLIINHIFLHPSANSSIKRLLIATVCSKEDSLKWDEFEFLLDIIKDYILGNPENPINGFELLFEIFKAAPLLKKAFITNSLLKSALEIYMKQNNALSQYLWNLMGKIFTYFKTFMDLKCSKNILIPILQWFIQEKIKWSSMRGFGVLDCISNYLPEIVLDVVPILTKTVEEMEHNRGMGEDVALRNLLKNTILKLQGKLSACKK